MSKILTIGMSGLNFDSGNKGCAALAYSFTDIILQVAASLGKKVRLNIFANSADMKCFMESNDSLVGWKIVEYHLLDRNTHNAVRKACAECDYIFDFTEGDSFSDIYGAKRYISNFFLKSLMVRSRKPYILGPQTYGPFNAKWSRAMARYILTNSMAVFSRDDMSTKQVKQISNRDINTYIDVAFALPYDTKNKTITDKTRIGINPSGLLWNGGYSGKNELGLTVQYKEYIRTLISDLTSNGHYEVHLISHVIDNDINAVDNDVVAVSALSKEFPRCIVAPLFETPMEAKSYISEMDLFMGARMHATIAAFSSGVATIPFSYSRKFEGLFGTLGYNYCIHGKSATTEDALNDTLQYVENFHELKCAVEVGMVEATKRIDSFKSQLMKLMQK